MGVVIEDVWTLKLKISDAGSRAMSAETRIQKMSTKTVGLRGLPEDLTLSVARERARIASPVDAEMLCVRTAVFLALLDIEVELPRLLTLSLMQFL